MAGPRLFSRERAPKVRSFVLQSVKFQIDGLGRCPLHFSGTFSTTGRKRGAEKGGGKGVRNEWHSEIRKSIAQLGIDRYRPPWVKDW